MGGICRKHGTSENAKERGYLKILGQRAGKD
jgi:hypothetical protein